MQDASSNLNLMSSPMKVIKEEDEARGSSQSSIVPQEAKQADHLFEASQNIPYKNLISVADAADLFSPAATELIQQHQVLSMDNEGTILNISCSKQSHDEGSSIFSPKKQQDNSF